MKWNGASVSDLIGYRAETHFWRDRNSAVRFATLDGNLFGTMSADTYRALQKKYPYLKRYEDLREQEVAA